MRTPLYAFGCVPRPVSAPVRLAVLGATGSIGTQTVDLAEQDPERVKVTVLSVRSRTAELALLVRRLEACGAADRPWIAVQDQKAHAAAAADPVLGRRLLPPGDAGVTAAAALDEVDVVVNGLVGAAGLAPTLAACSRGRTVALANKEALVMGGDLVTAAAASHGARVIPVDSEHSALAQCLTGRRPEELARLILTASGGPLRTWTAARMSRATRAEVLAHPTWDMGPKISVDSATLMNKGLEVIEAHVLFGTPYDAIDVVVHPGSIVHSLAEFRDGAVMAQLGAPDMHVPLLYAIWGERHEALAGDRLDLAALGELRFEKPDSARFPCLGLARAAGEAGGTAPIALNAANEVAVAAFLDERISYPDIAAVIEAVVTATPAERVRDLEHAAAADAAARRRAAAELAQRGARA